MNDISVAMRYGRAFFDVLSETGDDSARLSELSRLSDAMSGSKLLVQVLADRRVAISERTKIARRICNELSLHEYIFSGLSVAMSKGRGRELPLILDDAIERFCRKLRVLNAEAVVANDASVQDAKEKIEDILEQATGMDAKCEVSVDPSIMGGAIVKVAGKIFDGSIEGRLRKISERMGALE
jgi:F-type H+-transporting ATPase subunit delta